MIFLLYVSLYILGNKILAVSAAFVKIYSGITLDGSFVLIEKVLCLQKHGTLDTEFI